MHHLAVHSSCYHSMSRTEYSAAAMTLQGGPRAERIGAGSAMNVSWGHRPSMALTQ